MNVSLFNLIAIFRSSGQKVAHTLSPKTHCEQRHHHDFYCDAEMPHIAK